MNKTKASDSFHIILSNHTKSHIVFLASCPVVAFDHNVERVIALHSCKEKTKHKMANNSTNHLILNISVQSLRCSPERNGPIPGVGQGTERVVSQEVDHLAAVPLDVEQQRLVDLTPPLLGLLRRVPPRLVRRASASLGLRVILEVARPRGRQGGSLVSGNEPPKLRGNACQHKDRTSV